MKMIESEILVYLANYGYTNQVLMSETLDIALGAVNQGLNKLIAEGYVNESKKLTTYGKEVITVYKPKQAIILSAGFGVRMIPMNNELPKGLLVVKGECLIERLIIQLKHVGIEKIIIVVGFMKESFEYLIDKYNVKLVVNMGYAQKNNYASLLKATKYIDNCYILPSDLYFEDNPFRENEYNSWYLMDDKLVENQYARVNRKLEIVMNDAREKGHKMLSVGYINSDDGPKLIERLASFGDDAHYDRAFWEDALFCKKTMLVHARFCKQFIEVNTFEDYRCLSNSIDALNIDAFNIIKEVFNIEFDRIKGVKALKKGMTNNSFLFEVENQRYIMRIPGEGTEKLINRHQEYAVFKTIEPYAVADEVIYMNPDNGYKITKYLENSRSCDPENEKDLIQCMDYLKNFHQLNLSVDHYFDLFQKIEYYESLWLNQQSIYQDYQQVKTHIFELRDFLNTLDVQLCLTHVDAVCDNFLINEKGIKLIDWEYAAMQDPHLDVAMFSIYALYDKAQIDHLIDLYFDNQCSTINRKKIYAYVAVSGLVWSNWCEFKHHQGVEFGEYSLRQYRYAKEFYLYFKEEKI